MDQLPPKEETTESVVMIPDQQELYNSLLLKFSEELKSRGDSELKTGGMAMFMQLRKVANHPLLIRNLYTDRKLEEIAKLIAKVGTSLGILQLASTW